MLGATARKLRALGFDTGYFREGSDPELRSLARSEGRILLTSDLALSQLAAKDGITTFLVSGRSEVARFRSIARQAALASIDLTKGPTRCSGCNRVLLSVSKEKADGRVPAQLLSRHRSFYQCPSCEKLFWKGGHWSRLQRLSRSLRRPALNPQLARTPV